MTIAGHQTMLGSETIPSVFRYIGIKIIANKNMRSFSNLSEWRSVTSGFQNLVQFSRLDFINASGNAYSYPSNMQTMRAYSYLNRNMVTRFVAASLYAIGESYSRIFDHNTSTKFCGSGFPGGDSNTDIYDVSDVSYSAPESSRPYAYNLRSSYTATYYENTFGVNNRLRPFVIVLDLSDTPLDLSTYSRWQWYTANDTASQATGSGNRQWIEGEIIGSNDMKKWWRLDIFNDLNMPTTNYAIAYTGNLIPRKGNLWSDLDLATRDWTNGIAVDTVTTRNMRERE